MEFWLQTPNVHYVCAVVSTEVTGAVRTCPPPPHWNVFCSHLDWPSLPYRVAIRFKPDWCLLLSVTRSQEDKGESKHGLNPIDSHIHMQPQLVISEHLFCSVRHKLGMERIGAERCQHFHSVILTSNKKEQWKNKKLYITMSCQSVIICRTSLMSQCHNLNISNIENRVSCALQIHKWAMCIYSTYCWHITRYSFDAILPLTLGGEPLKRIYIHLTIPPPISVGGELNFILVWFEFSTCSTKKKCKQNDVKCAHTWFCRRKRQIRSGICTKQKNNPGNNGLILLHSAGTHLKWGDIMSALLQSWKMIQCAFSGHKELNGLYLLLVFFLLLLFLFKLSLSRLLMKGGMEA